MKKGTTIISVILIIALIGVIAYLIIDDSRERTQEVVNSAETSAVFNTTSLPDMSEPEETTKPLPEPVRDELLTLVNYENPVPDDWEVDLVTVSGDVKIDKRAYDALNDMLADAKNAGANPYVRNAYRSKELQQYLYDRKIRELRSSGYSEEAAEEETAKWIAYPGTSEHQLGLAADIVDSSYQTLDETQENNETQKWLMKNCWKYGFILRYPTDKSDITRINYEPWHYRYVGKKNAKLITDSGLCLEEYLEKTNGQR